MNKTKEEEFIKCECYVSNLSFIFKPQKWYKIYIIRLLFSIYYLRKRLDGMKQDYGWGFILGYFSQYRTETILCKYPNYAKPKLHKKIYATTLYLGRCISFCSCLGSSICKSAPDDTVRSIIVV